MCRGWAENLNFHAHSSSGRWAQQQRGKTSQALESPVPYLRRVSIAQEKGRASPAADTNLKSPEAGLARKKLCSLTKAERETLGNTQKRKQVPGVCSVYGRSGRKRRFGGKPELNAGLTANTQEPNTKKAASSTDVEAGEKEAAKVVAGQWRVSEQQEEPGLQGPGLSSLRVI